MKNLKTVPLLILKAVVTLAVFLFFALRVVQAYQEFSRLISGDFSAQDVFVIDEDKIKVGAQTKTIYQMVPDFHYLSAFIRREVGREPAQFGPYIKFYEKIVEYAPRMPDPHALLAFCYYQAGKIPEAMAAYKKAIEASPDFFYNYYNLGAIYLEQGNMPEARKIFAAALKSRPDVTIKAILSSKLYQQAVMGRFYPAEIMVNDLKENYGICRALAEGEPLKAAPGPRLF